ncbi:MAG: hypothetical protein SGCHY_005640, partial [Lobulomycetales sp.]
METLLSRVIQRASQKLGVTEDSFILEFIAEETLSVADVEYLLSRMRKILVSQTQQTMEDLAPSQMLPRTSLSTVSRELHAEIENGKIEKAERDNAPIARRYSLPSVQSASAYNSLSSASTRQKAKEDDAMSENSSETVVRLESKPPPIIYLVEGQPSAKSKSILDRIAQKLHEPLTDRFKGTQTRTRRALDDSTNRRHSDDALIANRTKRLDGGPREPVFSERSEVSR